MTPMCPGLNWPPAEDDQTEAGEYGVKLSDLMDDVRAALPEEKRKLVDAVVEAYGADENCHFMLALMATASKRERRLAKLLLSDLEQQEVE